MPTLELGFLGHGGDYNPDQWRDAPGVFEEDIRLMKLSGCNLMSVGIFSWAALEPQEGRYDFEWLQKVLDTFAENGIKAFLATPSGARPAWMSKVYPEVLRMRADGGRNLHGGRHNHCLTSPVYRSFVQKMNTQLAQRFGNHPAVVGWHISNELGGTFTECHCPLCQSAFRRFLREEYGTLEQLNHQWWTGFWSKHYSDWSEINSPSPVGETANHGLNLAWKRFITRRYCDYLQAELLPIRKYSPNLPVTTNLMQDFDGIDYAELVKHIDFVSFDSYPAWGQGTDNKNMGMRTAFHFDYMRALKKRPFALMESTPSQVNWQEVCKLKKPGEHFMSSLQALAHGADTVQYFQWRKGRGASEKFHGAVVDHVGHENTRTFKDVCEVGDFLVRLRELSGSQTACDAALIYDTQNLWALKDCQGPLREMPYKKTVLRHYTALKSRGINVDVISEDADFSTYKLVVAPMLYMCREGVGERLQAFVEQGGTLVVSARSGCVDADDLCYLGGFPGPLRAVTGIWAEETDAMYPQERNSLVCDDDTMYETDDLCDLIHAETAQVLCVYGRDFYAGSPALTKNIYGKGVCYYLAAQPMEDFLTRLYADLVPITIPVLCGNAKEGVDITRRIKDGKAWTFAINLRSEAVEIAVPKGFDYVSEKETNGKITLAKNGCALIEERQ